MKWSYFTVIGDASIEEGMPCSVCDRVEKDVLYYPTKMNDMQAKWIETIWGVDPWADFVVCENCMKGHCGIVMGLNADNWLEGWIKEFKAGKLTRSKTTQS